MRYGAADGAVCETVLRTLLREDVAVCDTVLRTLLCEDGAVCDTVLRTLLCEDVASERYGAADAAVCGRCSARRCCGRCCVRKLLCAIRCCGRCCVGRLLRDTVLRTLLCEDGAARYGAADAAV